MNEARGGVVTETVRLRNAALDGSGCTALPSTWLNRTLRVQYRNAFDEGVETSGVLAGLFPFGMILNIASARTVIAWDCVRVVELVED
jgi:hypothetical protein